MIVSLTTAVIFLAVFLFLVCVGVGIYFVRRRYFPNEARMLKKLGQRELKSADIERIVSRIKTLEYSTAINKYNQTECLIC